MTTMKRCSSCGTISGTCVCTGCQSLFCPQHFHDHRYYMTKQLNQLMGNCNRLVTKTKETNQIQRIENSLLGQIDNWEKSMMEKVMQTADNTRQQILQLINRKKSEIIERIESIGKEILLRKDINDFVEDDLTRLNNMINSVQLDLDDFIRRPIQLYVNKTPQVDWNKLVSIEYGASNNFNKKSQIPILTERNYSSRINNPVVSSTKKNNCLYATGCEDCFYVPYSGGWNDGGFYRRSDTGGYCHCTCHQNEKKKNRLS
ncbi:unnamed protein product [Adineta ricciae]|uniref:B box-type domain-containing protein n=1 Tax=Adineta ricciae TaxID=249248 RepID=A0A815NH83_ADIRI|nr:unnamed protein product [Adineta ricciae]CAF1431934.1 unnamed protein product [Adineta ricciae]